MISSLQQLQSATATHSRNFLSNFQLSPPADEETGDVFSGTNRIRTRFPAVVKKKKKGRALRSFFCTFRTSRGTLLRVETKGGERKGKNQKSPTLGVV